jgi:hypothetical protein
MGKGGRNYLSTHKTPFKWITRVGKGIVPAARNEIIGCRPSGQVHFYRALLICAGIIYAANGAVFALKSSKLFPHFFKQLKQSKSRVGSFCNRFFGLIFFTSRSFLDAGAKSHFLTTVRVNFPRAGNF